MPKTKSIVELKTEFEQQNQEFEMQKEQIQQQLAEQKQELVQLMLEQHNRMLNMFNALAVNNNSAEQLTPFSEEEDASSNLILKKRTSNDK